VCKGLLVYKRVQAGSCGRLYIFVGERVVCICGSVGALYICECVGVLV